MNIPTSICRYGGLTQDLSGRYMYAVLSLSEIPSLSKCTAIPSFADTMVLPLPTLVNHECLLPPTPFTPHNFWLEGGPWWYTVLYALQVYVMLVPPPPQHRANVLLLGDSQGDPSMTDGINGMNSHSIIKIGFLNHDVCSLAYPSMGRGELGSSHGPSLAWGT